MFELLNKKTYRLLFVFSVIGTLVLTLGVPIAIELAKAGLFNDKIAHAITFFVLAFLYSHTLGSKFGWQSLLLLAAFGLAIEFIQYFLPWRSFSWLDWIADIIGILSYDVIHRIKRRWLINKN